MNIHLERFRQDHIPAVLRWTEGTDSRDLILWAGPTFIWPLTFAQLEAYIPEEHEHRRFYCICDAGEPVGIIALESIDRVHRNARIAKVFVGAPGYRGRGVATKALQQLLEICFQQLVLHKVSLGVLSENIAARSCYIRNGFLEEGIRKEYRLVRGVWHDLIEMSITAVQWQPEYPCLPVYHTETRRLVLRSADTSDHQRILAYHRKNRDFLSAFGPKRPEWFYTEACQRSMNLQEIMRERRGKSLRCWIALKTHPEVFIGSVSLSELVRGNFNSCFLGYQLDEDHLRRGYMSEALAAVLDIAFDLLELHRIEANIMPGNRASIATAERLGFRREGLAERYLRIGGIWTDHLHYTLLNEDRG